MIGVTRLPYHLQRESINITNCHTSSWDVLRCRNQLWWQCHKSPQRSEELTTLAGLLAWAVPCSACILSYSEHLTSCAGWKEVLTRGWALTAHKEWFSSSVKPDNPWNPCPVRAGRSLNRTEWSPLIWHFKQIWIWCEQLTRCHWSCWWQQFSPKS